MNTIMKNCAECRFCGKTIRFLNAPVSGVITVDAESTAPEDTTFDPQRHVAHRPVCPQMRPALTVNYASGVTLKIKKKPCGCKEKKNVSKPQTT